MRELGGIEGAEVIMWLVMRGAMSANVRKVHQSYYLPSVTGIATAIYENEAIAVPADTAARHRAPYRPQLEGAENLAGTYPFTHARSRQRLSAQQVPASAGRARASRAFPGRRRSRPSRRRA